MRLTDNSWPAMIVKCTSAMYTSLSLLPRRGGERSAALGAPRSDFCESRKTPLPRRSRACRRQMHMLVGCV